MQRARPPEGDQREKARIVPALDRDDAQRALHGRVRDPHDAGRGGFDGAPEAARERRDRPLGAGAVEPHRTAEELGLHQPAEDQIRVGHGRRAPAAVAGRPRVGACALGADAQRAAAIEPRERPAARAHGVDVERGHAHGKPVDGRLAPVGEGTVDQAHVGRRAPHVERDDAPVPGATGTLRCADDAAGGSGEDRAHRLGTRHGRADEPASRLHDAEAASRNHGRQRAQVAGHQRADVGVERRGRHPLVLAVLAQQPVREGHVQAAPGERPAEPALVRRTGVAVEETDGDRRRPAARDGGQRACHLTRAERRLDGPVDEHALAHADAPRARHERRRPARLERVERGAHLAADLEHVLEAGGGEQRDARAAPLEERVGRDRRAVVQARGAAQRGEPGAHRGRRVVRRGADLQDTEPPADHGHQVGEGAAGVDADEDGPGGQEAGFSLVLAGLVSDFASDLPSDLLSVAADSLPLSFLPPFPLPARG